jgi:hypothetical protein
MDNRVIHACFYRVSVGRGNDISFTSKSGKEFFVEKLTDASRARLEHLTYKDNEFTTHAGLFGNFISLHIRPVFKGK